MMKLLNRRIIFYFSLATITLLLNSCADKPEKSGTRFILASHSYYTIRYPGLFEKYIGQIGQEKNIDHIFFLGDLVNYSNEKEWQIVLDATSRLRPKPYFAPGNHDIYKLSFIESKQTVEPYPEWKAEYIARIGYDYKIIEDANVNFVLINSLDPLDNIKAFLERNDKTFNNNKPNILLSHHLLWDDTDLKSDWKTWAHKSYRWDQIEPLLANFKHLFAGDRCEHCRNKNKTIPLKDGKIGYNIGIGEAGSTLFYVIAEFRDGKINLEVKTVEVDTNHPYFTDQKS